MRLFASMLLAMSMLTIGCATSQEITLGKVNHAKPIRSIAQVVDEGNSPQMNDNLAFALQKQGLTVKGTQPQGTTRSTETDALISYVDVWRWDIVMYLKSLTVKLHDATTGDLLAIGHWNDSALHGFRDSRLVMDGLVSELLTKVRGAEKTADAK
jgi:hypothetical protein